MEIILGKSKTGKSTKIYESINEDIQKGYNPILFVPSQTREITELEYMKSLKKDGIINVDITTISEYISSNLKKNNMHLEENYISKLDKKIIVSNVIDENKDRLKLFKNVSKKDGFISIVYMYIDLFRKNNITKEYLKENNIKNEILKQKIEEIFMLYEEYVKKINDKYIDGIDEINLWVNNIELYKNELKNSKIYFDGYNNFTKSELEFIKSLLSLNVETTYAINTDITDINDIYIGNTNDIFEIPNKTYLSLLKIASSVKNENVNTTFLYNDFSKANKDILYLADNIFEPVKKKKNIENDSINLNIYSNVKKEIEAVAYNICKKRKEGLKYNDFCIYTTDVTGYESIISRVFYEYNIPLYVDTKRKVQTSRLVEYIIQIMQMATSGIKVDSIISLLKKGLNDFDLNELAYLENYVLEFNINKYNVDKEWYLNNEGYGLEIYDLDKINEIRKKAVLEFYDTVVKLKVANNAKDIVEIIYDHLIDKNIFVNYYNLSSNIEDKTYFLYSSKADYKIWEKISEVFDSICKINDRESINISEFLNQFKVVISEIYVKSVPPTKDKVILADINVSKVGNKKVAFFIGVTDGNFPKKYDEDILFSDREIEDLEKNEIEFKETSISKESMGKYNIYEALHNITDNIYISMPAVDVKSETTRKSSIISQIEDTVNIKLIGEVTNSKEVYMNIDDIYSKEKCFEYMVKLISSLDNCLKSEDIENLPLEKLEDYTKKIDDALTMYNYYTSDSNYSEVLNYIKSDDNLSKESVDLIYKDEFKSSVYKLEQFNKCPFSYYLKYILNINKRKVYEITSMDTGSLMHNIIDVFSKYLIENNIKWKDIIDENDMLKDIYEKKFSQIMYDLLKNEFKKQKESVKYGIYVKKLESTMKKVLAVIAKSFKQSDFEMLGNEIEFSDNSVYLPIVLNLENGITMKIIGKIDRVDIYNDEGGASYIRVIDYKSSKKSLSVKNIKEGISLQLITYLNAILQNNKSYKPAACLYFNLSNNLIKLKEYTPNDDKIKEEIIKELRMNGLFLKDVKILENMDKYVKDSKEKLIDISPSKMSNATKALEETEFDNLCKEALDILKNIGNEMTKGVVKINLKKKNTACDYCDFAGVCRKESCI